MPIQRFSCKICGKRVVESEWETWTGAICPDCRRAAYLKGKKLEE